MDQYFITICFFQRLEYNSESKLIERAEGLDASHAGTLFEDADGKMKIKHSDDNGVEVVSLEETFKIRRIAHAYRIRSLMPRAGFSEFAWGRVQRKVKYSVWQLYLNQALRFFGLSRAPIRNGDSETICCEETYIDLRSTVLGAHLIHDQDKLGLREFKDWLDEKVASGVIEKVNPELMALF